MGYLHIDNLYKNQEILLFKECYVLEKIHGTSANISWDGNKVTYFSGGEKLEKFKSIFNEQALIDGFNKLGINDITIYGEAYGGKCQGMSATYGKALKFVVFDVQIGKSWLSVPDMDNIATGMGLEVVHWERLPTDLSVLDAHRDAPSVQAKRNGCGDDKHREGVVLRPLIELTKNNGQRVIVKHKQPKFEERATPQKIVDPAKLKVLEEAKAIADEWVTPMRLIHVLDKLPEQDKCIEHMSAIIKAMVEDVYREASGEIVESKEAAQAIGTRTAKLFKEHLNNLMHSQG